MGIEKEKKKSRLGKISTHTRLAILIHMLVISNIAILNSRIHLTVTKIENFF